MYVFPWLVLHTSYKFSTSKRFFLSHRQTDRSGHMCSWKHLLHQGTTTEVVWSRWQVLSQNPSVILLQYILSCDCIKIIPAAIVHSAIRLRVKIKKCPWCSLDGINVLLNLSSIRLGGFRSISVCICVCQSVQRTTKALWPTLNTL